MKITRIIFLTAAVMVSKGYAQAKEYKPKEKTIYLKKGETYRIELEGAGYKWHDSHLSKDAPIKIIEVGFTKQPATICGAPGKQYWVIKARRKPTSTDIAHLIIHDKRLNIGNQEGINTYILK